MQRPSNTVKPPSASSPVAAPVQVCWMMVAPGAGVPFHGPAGAAAFYQYAYQRAVQAVRASSYWGPSVSLN